MTNEVVQSIEDLFAEFEAWVKKFRSHPAVQAAASNTTPTGAPATEPAPAHVDPHPSFDWAPYKNHTDREAFFAFAQKMGRAPNPDEEAAAYAAGVARELSNDHSSGDLHNSPNLGFGGQPYAFPVSSGTEPVSAVANVTFSLRSSDKASKRLKVSPDPTCRLTSVHIKATQGGNVVSEGDAQLNTAPGGEEAKFLVGELADGDYAATLTIVGFGDVSIDLATA